MTENRTTNEQPVCPPGNRGLAGCSHNRSTLVIALTGGIADGKTTVGRMFQALGAEYVSADQIAHDLLKQGTDAWREVVREFGVEILSSNEEIDRRKLGEIVFDDPEKRHILEKITHPYILSRLNEIVEEFRERSCGILILEVPLLLETEFPVKIDKIVVVASEQELQISRLQERYSMNREAALKRIAAQLPTFEKVKRADWVIRTNTSLEETAGQVERVYMLAQKLLAQGK